LLNFSEHPSRGFGFRIPTRIINVCAYALFIWSINSLHSVSIALRILFLS
jgi:hypothetical protein